MTPLWSVNQVACRIWLPLVGTVREEIREGRIGSSGDAAFHRGIAVAARSSVLSRLMDEMAEAVEAQQ